MEEDKIIISTNNSRKFYIPIYAMVILLLIIVAFLKNKEYSIDKMAIIATGAFVLLGLFGTEIHRLKNKYEIAYNSVIHTEGYFNKVAKRFDLFAVSDVKISQNWWERIWNFGDVDIHLFSAESKISIKKINNPKNFALILEKQMAKRRRVGRK